MSNDRHVFNRIANALERSADALEKIADQGAWQTSVMNVPAKLTPEEVERVRSAWRDKYPADGSEVSR